MNFYARNKYQEDDTIYTWFSKILRMNGTNLVEFFHIMLPKTGLNATNIIDVSLAYIEQQFYIKPEEDLTRLSNLSYLNIFYKEGTLRANRISQKRLWGNFCICPECLNHNIRKNEPLEFRKVDQLPLKKVCTVDYRYLINAKQLRDLLIDGNNVEYREPSAFDINLSLFIENVFEYRHELNHLILMKALVNEMTNQKNVLDCMKRWHDVEAQALLKEIPEYRILSRYGHFSFYKFVHNLYLSDMQISDELFITALYLTFQQSSIFNTAIEASQKDEQSYEDLKEKIKLILKDKTLREEMLGKSQTSYLSSNNSIREEMIDEEFREKVKRATNERYMVVKEFEKNGEEFAEILHEDCGNRITCTKDEFLDRKARCPHCKKQITEWMLEGMVEEKGKGRYHLSKLHHLVQTYQYFVEDITNDNLYSLSKKELLKCIETGDWSVLNEQHQIPSSFYVYKASKNPAYRMYFNEVYKL